VHKSEFLSRKRKRNVSEKSIFYGVLLGNFGYNSNQYIPYIEGLIASWPYIMR
jgi:hypothetical protein